MYVYKYFLVQVYGYLYTLSKMTFRSGVEKATNVENILQTALLFADIFFLLPQESNYPFQYFSQITTLKFICIHDGSFDILVLIRVIFVL